MNFKHWPHLSILALLLGGVIPYSLMKNSPSWFALNTNALEIKRDPSNLKNTEFSIPQVVYLNNELLKLESQLMTLKLDDKNKGSQKALNLMKEFEQLKKRVQDLKPSMTSEYLEANKLIAEIESKIKAQKESSITKDKKDHPKNDENKDTIEKVTTSEKKVENQKDIENKLEIDLKKAQEKSKKAKRFYDEYNLTMENFENLEQDFVDFTKPKVETKKEEKIQKIVVKTSSDSTETEEDQLAKIVKDLKIKQCEDKQRIKHLEEELEKQINDKRTIAELVAEFNLKDSADLKQELNPYYNPYNPFIQNYNQQLLSQAVLHSQYLYYSSLFASIPSPFLNFGQNYNIQEIQQYDSFSFNQLPSSTSLKAYYSTPNPFELQQGSQKQIQHLLPTYGQFNRENGQQSVFDSNFIFNSIPTTLLKQPL